MTDPKPHAADVSALLALHFEEGDERLRARTRAHVEACESCREYLRALTQVEDTLRGWGDEAPPAGLGDRVVAHAVGSSQAPARPSAPRALPLLGLLPTMAALVAISRLVAARLLALPYWAQVERWPVVELLGAAGVAALLVILGGGLASLAIAPALVLESRRRRELAPAA